MVKLSNNRRVNIIIAVLAIVTCCFFSIYTYTDIILTTGHSIKLWYIIFGEGSIGNFYSIPYPLDTSLGCGAYDFFIYIIFAIWDLPLFIYEKISHVSFKDNYITLLYAKAILLLFLTLCAIQINRLAIKITNDKEKANWSVFAFVFSTMVSEAVVIIGGYDVISIFFTLCGIEGYLENKNKKFLFYFACAIACKMFAIFIFVPLILLKWKKLRQVIWRLIAGIGFIAVPKICFILYGRLTAVSNMDNVSVSQGSVSVSDVISHSGYLYYLWGGGEAPLQMATMPLFFGLVFILWFWCWFNRKQLSDRIIIYICLLSMSAFILTCYTHPQWVILIMPYIALLECFDWKNIPQKLFLEVSMGIGHVLWSARCASWCYGYNIVNNMLNIEEDSTDFWFMGIPNFVGKLADMVGVSIDNVWILIRNIYDVAFILLLIYLFPKSQSEANFTGNEEKCFCIKAVCGVLVLLIPLLGVYIRFNYYSL